MSGEQERFLAELDGLDELERYDRVMRLALSVGEVDSSLRQPEHEFPGCQVTVWLRLGVEDGRLRAAADSDALVVRAMAVFLASLFDGRGLAEAAGMRVWFFEDCRLDCLLSGEVRGTLRRLAEAVRDFAGKRLRHNEDTSGETT